MFALNFPMLLAGFLVTGLAVGAGVPASWTYISKRHKMTIEQRILVYHSLHGHWDRQLFSFSGTVLAPLGLFGNRILFGLLTVIAFIAWLLQRGLGESKAWQDQKAFEKSSGEKSHPYRTLFSNKTSLKWLCFLVGV